MRAFDFYLIRTKLSPQKILKVAALEVFGNYDQQESSAGGDEPGLLAMPFNRDWRLVKLDMGPWPHYTEFSEAVAGALAKCLRSDVLVCGYATEQELSWVWLMGPVTGSMFAGQATKDRGWVRIDSMEDADGPRVTDFSLRRWGVSPRDAARELKQRATWEAKRRWMLADPKKRGGTAYHSFMAGNLLLGGQEQGLIEEEWRARWPRRRPESGPLCWQVYFQPTAAVEKHRPKVTAGSEPTKFVKEGRTVIESELGADGQFRTTGVDRTDAGGRPLLGPAGADLLAGDRPDVPALPAPEIRRTQSNIREFMDRLRKRR